MLCVCLTTPTQSAVLFACLMSSWATTMGRLLGPKTGNGLIVFPRDRATH